MVEVIASGREDQVGRNTVANVHIYRPAIKQDGDITVDSGVVIESRCRRRGRRSIGSRSNPSERINGYIGICERTSITVNRGKPNR